MARNRASMREGPLADLFRATEAAQRQGKTPDGQQELPVETPEPVLEAAEPPPSPTPIRAVEPVSDPDPVADEAPSRVSRWLDPLRGATAGSVRKLV